MDAEGLKKKQAGVKDAYKADGEKAKITLKATGELGREHLTCSLNTGKALVEAGLHEFAGGDVDLGFACSGDILLQSLVACAGVTFGAVATSFGLNWTGGKVTAEGDLDFRGTLGIDKTVPIGFSKIKLSFEVNTDADEQLLQKVLSVTERYCVVLQTLKTPPAFESTITKH